MMTFETTLDNAKRTKCEVWTRAMGYCRPVSNFNKGKKSEFYERKYFTNLQVQKHSICHWWN